MSSIDINKPLKCISGLPIRDVKYSKECKCSLTGFNIIGQIFVNNNWFWSKWNEYGENSTRIESWRLVNESSGY